MTRKITLIALVPVLALGLAACGSSNSDSTSSPSTSSTSMSSMPMPSETPSSKAAESPTSSASDAASPVITITDFKFKVPASVAPGATITIKNGDSQAHTVTSKSGGFDVKIDPNGTATMKAPDKAGSFDFVCTFHADMSSTLVVK
ncbi:cupredoxin domain-containing protein [Phycicoccus sp. Root563]|uniref:cupredoxin domain-containing protein n=1 Tax=Phycicoccus sp. Root563 TaxID=1736562 RepID=UPI0009E917DD|nr:cupredoxin domain-containing protein [Phycicoccus sp. Root563]